MLAVVLRASLRTATCAPAALVSLVCSTALLSLSGMRTPHINGLKGACGSSFGRAAAYLPEKIALFQNNFE